MPPPTLANGKICHIEMPAIDVQGSADFYGKVFGWGIRRRVGRVRRHDRPSERDMGVLGRPASAQPGLLA